MADIERMTIVFPEQMAAEIRATVKAGEYASTSEAVRDAVRLWRDRREMRGLERDALRRVWDEGKASGIAGRHDMRKLLAETKAEAKRSPRARKRG
jgi:antitoxin ParD1/3/4